METFKFYQKSFLIMLLVLCSIGQGFSQQVLVSGTDFEVTAGAQNETYTGIENVVYTGLLTPDVTLAVPVAVDIAYDYNAASMPVSSHFHDLSQYAVTSNPIKLDSLHYVDDPLGGWGIVFSPARIANNKTLMQYRVSGMTPGSIAEVRIEYRSVIDDTKLVACGNGDSRAQFKVAINAGQYNQTQGEEVPAIEMGATGSYTNATVTVTANGTVDIRINAVSGYSGECHAFEITKIEVYGEIAPEIYCVEGDEVCAGEQISLKSMKQYPGVTYQWYHNGMAVAGVTYSSYLCALPAVEGSHTFRLDVKIGTVTVKSNEIVVRAIECCEVDGVPASRRVVYRDDFGEFDLSDTTGKTYKVWDYSDIKNPQQITKKTTTPFRYALDNPPLAAVFDGGPGPLEDGYYCVAGVLTGENPVAGLAGARLGWSNRIGGKENPRDPEYDHSGLLEGCCLLLNCPSNRGGHVLYERTLDNLDLCVGKQLFFECYITVITDRPTDRANDIYEPVDITVKLTEIGNPTNVKTKRVTATREADGGTGTWVKIRQEIFLEINGGIKFEIINNENTDQNGNDLALDDIIVRVCAAPSLKAYFDLDNLDVGPISCNGGDVEIFANPSEMLTNYFGGIAYTYFLYQWTTTPDVKTSWKNLSAPVQTLSFSDLVDLFQSMESGDKVYFRVIAGTQRDLMSTLESDFNEDDPCANYTVSNIIEALVDYPVCTEPGKVYIQSDKPLNVNVPVKKVELCSGESVTLTSNDVTPASGYQNYTFQWYKGDKNTPIGEKTNGIQAGPLTVTYSNTGSTVADTMYYLQVVDFDFPESISCYKWDSIIVVEKVMPQISDKADTICSGEEFKIVPQSVPGGDIVPNGTIYSWSVPVVSGITGLSAGVDADSIGGMLTNTTDTLIRVTYNIIPKSGDCEGSAFKVAIVVYPIPHINSVSNDTICSGVASPGVTLSSPSGSATTYKWTAVTSGVTGLVNTSGTTRTIPPELSLNATGTTAGTVTYTITPSIGGCAGYGSTYVIIVNPVPLPTEISIPAFKEGESPDLSETKRAMSSINFDKYDMFVNVEESLTSITSAEDMVGLIDRLALTSEGSPYTFEYTVTDKTTGCISDSEDITVIVEVSTHIDTIISETFRLHPNPVRKNTYLILDIRQEIITGKSVWIEVYNTKGILLRHFPVSSPRMEIRSESVEGTYLYIIRNQDRIMKIAKVMVT